MRPTPDAVIESWVKERATWSLHLTAFSATEAVAQLPFSLQTIATATILALNRPYAWQRR